MSKKIDKIVQMSEKIMAIRFLVLDVDGVMTDGSISYTSRGEELKTFDVKDGAGLKWWNDVGFTAGIITGRSSPVVERRAAELGIQFVEMGATTKLSAFERVLDAAGMLPGETVVIGDDLPDLPLITRAGLGVAVADAVEEVKEAADLVTDKKGGHGAVREIIELILKTQGRWQMLVKQHLV